ncbi:MAG: hypothetical protein LBJ21_06805 [Acidobacteriota bacterium]|nr:hypothetical protein [Acidobacteriota bacterium]
MRRALAPILFEDHELPVTRHRRDPVLPAKASEAAKAKKRTRRTKDGFVVHSFATLLSELSTRAKNTCRMISDAKGPTFRQVTKPNSLQAKAFELLELICFQ